MDLTFIDLNTEESMRNPWKSCWNALSMSINAPCSSNKMCALKKYWKTLTTLFSGNVFISRLFIQLCPLIVTRQMCIIISTHMWEMMLWRCDHNAKRAILCSWRLSRTHIMKWWKIWRKTYCRATRWSKSTRCFTSVCTFDEVLSNYVRTYFYLHAQNSIWWNPGICTPQVHLCCGVWGINMTLEA